MVSGKVRKKRREENHGIYGKRTEITELTRLSGLSPS
jgi:hypothetical protein